MTRFVHLAFAGMCVAALSTACSSSGSPGSANTPAASTAPSVPTTAPSTGGTPADSATLTAIGTAYSTFFSSASTTPQSQAVLQNGAKFTATLEEQAKTSYAAKSSATVDSARIVRPGVAAVTFSVTSGGSTLLSKAPGYAVKTGATWQVAAQTFCGLLELEQAAPDACDDPSVTALPH